MGLTRDSQPKAQRVAGLARQAKSPPKEDPFRRRGAFLSPAAKGFCRLSALGLRPASAGLRGRRRSRAAALPALARESAPLRSQAIASAARRPASRSRWGAGLSAAGRRAGAVAKWLRQQVRALARRAALSPGPGLPKERHGRLARSSVRATASGAAASCRCFSCHAHAARRSASSSALIDVVAQSCAAGASTGIVTNTAPGSASPMRERASSQVAAIAT